MLERNIATLQTERDAIERELTDANAERTWLNERLSAERANSQAAIQENERLRQQLQEARGAVDAER